MNKYIVGLFVGTLLLPFSAFADTQAQILEHISLLQQVVSLLEQELQTLNSQVTHTIQAPVKMQDFGNTMYSITATPSFGSGSWSEHSDKCSNTDEHGAIIQPEGYDCSNTFLDGIINFAITPTPVSACISYYPTNSPENIAKSCGLFNNGMINGAGFFQPNTDYTWEITATNEAGETATTSGTFTTGDYPI